MSIECASCGGIDEHTPSCGMGETERQELVARLGRSPTAPEPAPLENDRPAVWGLIIDDMKSRDKFGFEKYGVRLQPHNGRDPLKDLYQELLDAIVYLRQAIYERDGE